MSRKRRWTLFLLAILIIYAFLLGRIHSARLGRRDSNDEFDDSLSKSPENTSLSLLQDGDFEAADLSDVLDTISGMDTKNGTLAQPNDGMARKKAEIMASSIIFAAFFILVHVGLGIYFSFFAAEYPGSVYLFSIFHFCGAFPIPCFISTFTLDQFGKLLPLSIRSITLDQNMEDISFITGPFGLAVTFIGLISGVILAVRFHCGLVPPTEMYISTLALLFSAGVIRSLYAVMEASFRIQIKSADINASVPTLGIAFTRGYMFVIGLVMLAILVMPVTWKYPKVSVLAACFAVSVSEFFIAVNSTVTYRFALAGDAEVPTYVVKTALWILASGCVGFVVMAFIGIWRQSKSTAKGFTYWSGYSAWRLSQVLPIGQHPLTPTTPSTMVADMEQKDRAITLR